MFDALNLEKNSPMLVHISVLELKGQSLNKVKSVGLRILALFFLGKVISIVPQQCARPVPNSFQRITLSSDGHSSSYSTELSRLHCKANRDSQPLSNCDVLPSCPEKRVCEGRGLPFV